MPKKPPKATGTHLRDRGLYVPSWHEASLIESDEDRERVQLVCKLRSALYTSWRKFALEHYSEDIPECSAQEDAMWAEFISCYVGFLRSFKIARRKRGNIDHYYHSIRINAYDHVYSVWKGVAELYRTRSAVSHFHDEFGRCAVEVGYVMKELDLIAGGYMNVGERMIVERLRSETAASVRHAENRAMKAEAFEWLDSNFDHFRNMDKAAQAIEGRVPIGFRAARSWVGEWKKLRSPKSAQ
jgi:hypothetical protein